MITALTDLLSSVIEDWTIKDRLVTGASSKLC